jgi:hypothetical protein
MPTDVLAFHGTSGPVNYRHRLQKTESRTQNKLVREEDKIMSLGTVLSAASAGVTSRPKPGTATPTVLT